MILITIAWLNIINLLSFFCLPLSLEQDYSFGFGGKYGVQKDRQDKSALSWEHHEKLKLHASQQGFTHDPFASLATISWFTAINMTRMRYDG